MHAASEAVSIIAVSHSNVILQNPNPIDAAPRRRRREAKAILEKVKRKDSVARARLTDLQKIIDAYIHLAVLPVKKTGGEAIGPHMPRSVKELGDLVHAPIVTKTMPVDTTCRYAKDHFAHFVQFKNECIS